jgi:selenide,water dikinase
MIVGFETADDAGVVVLDEQRALVQTVDFFTPIVDDAYTYGLIAAANALSDVYAMGGEPLTAMNIVGFPDRDLPASVLERILAGGLAKITEAGAILVGGHSVRDSELKYGLSVTGIVHPQRVWRNYGAQPGDRLILTKKIGTGVLTTARKRDAIPAEALDEAIASMQRLNRDAMLAGRAVAVHACTDITGNGLAGHAWEMARASEAKLIFDFSVLPLLPGVVEAAKAGHCPGGANANRAFVGAGLEVNDLEPHEASIVLDPQTSGGLLFAVPESDVTALCAGLETRGVLAAVVGRVESGLAGVRFARGA